MRRLYLIVALILLAILFAFPQLPKEGSLLVSADDFSYGLALKQANSDFGLSITRHDSPLRVFEQGFNIATFDTLAAPLVKANNDYHFEPHHVQTIIIALDRDQTNLDIRSFFDLMISGLGINFDFGQQVDANYWQYPQTHQVLSAMSLALFGEYDIEALSEQIKWLDSQNRFFYDDFSQEAIVTYDNIAVEMIKTGRNLDIIVPGDGSLSFIKGVLSSNDSLSFDEDLDSILIQEGFRLPDGRADGQFYPSPLQYQYAQTVDDYQQFNQLASSSSEILRRASFDDTVYGFANAKEMTAFYFGLLFVLIIHLVSVIKRVSQSKIRAALVNVLVLQILFAGLACFKSIIDQSAALETAFWYCYYIPILLIPAIFVYIALNCGYLSKIYHRGAYRVYLGITLLLLLLVLTNNLHNWVFIVHDPILTIYNYNFAYAIVLSWVVISGIVGFVLLFWQSFKSPRKRAFIWPCLMVLLAITYAFCYAMRIPIISDFNIAYGQTIVFSLCMEACLQSRLFPINKGYFKLFSSSHLAMEIRDNQQNIMVKAKNAPQLNNNFILRQSQIKGGNFYYYEDYSSLNNARQNLATINQRLVANNQFLKQQAKVNADLSALAAEEAAYQNIDQIIKIGSAKIADCLEQMQKTADITHLIWRINIVACTIKREAMLLINSLYQKEQASHIFINYIIEMQEFALPIQLKITVGCTISGQIPLEQALAMYRLYYTLVEKASVANCQNLLVQLYKQEQTMVFSLIADQILFTQEDLAKFSQNLLKNSKITIKPWDDTEAVLLSFKLASNMEAANV